MAVALAEVFVASKRTERTEEGMRMGDEIEAIRKEGPFTQQQVAGRLGLSLQGYLGYRRGYTRVTPNTLRKWATALDVPIPDLAERLGIDLLTEDVKAHCCRPCSEQCDVLILAAVGETTRVWKCPMLVGTDLMDRAVALALIRAALDGTACVVIRISDVDCQD